MDLLAKIAGLAIFTGCIVALILLSRKMFKRRIADYLEATKEQDKE